MTGPSGEYVLGIDLGSNSVGWAMIGLVDGVPDHLLRTGVRVFAAGVEGDLESGREESRNLKRRQMRSQRRQTWRRARRLRGIFNLLQRFGLLPPRAATSSEKRQDVLNELDKSIRASGWFKEKIASDRFREPLQAMPYILRTSALDEKLDPYFLGRAIYHLARHRGFPSVQKKSAKKDEDEGPVKEGNAELRRLMAEDSARTLGEYFSTRTAPLQRAWSRWTARDMFETEFNAVWEAQSRFQPDLLTAGHRRKLLKAFFFQRPRWLDRNAIGKCELEHGERRAPAYLLTSQRFRLLESVNNLKVISPDEIEKPLIEADRKRVIDELETSGDRTFTRISKLLSLGPGYSIDLERDGEKSIAGNRTNAAFMAALGDRWQVMPPEERERTVEYVHSFRSSDKLKSAAVQRFGLDEDAAQGLAGISLERGYVRLSRKAIQKLLPLLEQGMPYAQACKQVYPESFKSAQPHASLPSVRYAFGEIRDPALTRSLTELRKVVNAIVRQYGKPVRIRIQLARTLRKPRKQRAALSVADRRNTRARARAAREISEIMKDTKTKPDDIRKFLLAEECGWQCPYTGKPISMQSLFAPEPQFDIEHIIPFSRSLDNSFYNLTLCYVQESRALKDGKTPYEAYAADPERYGAIKRRVMNFIGRRIMVAVKLKLFSVSDDELEFFLDNFRMRKLNDQTHGTSLAAQYLGLLYGGTSDAAGKERVQAVSGLATRYLRKLWKLNFILDNAPAADEDTQPRWRDDHRHQAADAIVVGVTDARMVERLFDAAKRAPRMERKLFAPLESPWPNFAGSVRNSISKIIVSRRVSKKASGALHEETHYSAPSAEGCVRVRKPLAALTQKEVRDIADESVKVLVLAKLNGGDPRQVFAREERLPFFETSDGRRIPIRRARINKNVPTFTLGEGRIARHVTNAVTHHLEVHAEVGGGGKEGKWVGEVIPMQEACWRLRTGQPVVERDRGSFLMFKFSLAPGEVIECDDGKGARKLWVVCGASSRKGLARLSLVPTNDARSYAQIKAAGSYWRPALSALRKLNTRKVVVSPLGDLIEAND